MIHVPKYLLGFVILFFGIAEIYLRFYSSYNEPYFDKKNKIVKRKKYTQGQYQTKHTNSGYFRINNEGWNSHRDYNPRIDCSLINSFKTEALESKQDSIVRIAIIGHSNVEGLRVPFDKTFSKILEENLMKDGVNVEVYTFGYGGMHLAQALHVSRYVEAKFQPDIFIIGTLLDDFLIDCTYKKNFLNLKINTVNDIMEVLPEAFKYEGKSSFTFLYFLKTIKYADERTGFGQKLNRRLHTKSDKRNNDCKLSEEEMKGKTSLGIDYILKEFNKIATKNSKPNTPVFFINFPLTLPSHNYSFNDSEVQKEKQGRAQIIQKIKDCNFHVIDLEEAFLTDFKLNAQNFDFVNDCHYNEHAHKVIGDYLTSYFKPFLCSNYLLND